MRARSRPGRFDVWGTDPREATVISCPDCEAAVPLPEDVRLNEVLECGECRIELEVVSVEPVLVALAPEIEEDWGE
jgi:alpha-aminoadipate carrier protein LysW